MYGMHATYSVAGSRYTWTVSHIAIYRYAWDHPSMMPSTHVYTYSTVLEYTVYSHARVLGMAGVYVVHVYSRVLEYVCAPLASGTARKEYLCQQLV